MNIIAVIINVIEVTEALYKAFLLYKNLDNSKELLSDKNRINPLECLELKKKYAPIIWSNEPRKSCATGGIIE